MVCSFYIPEAGQLCFVYWVTFVTLCPDLMSLLDRCRFVDGEEENAVNRTISSNLFGLLTV